VAVAGPQDLLTLLVTAQIERCESVVADGKFLRCWNHQYQLPVRIFRRQSWLVMRRHTRVRRRLERRDTVILSIEHKQSQHILNSLSNASRFTDGTHLQHVQKGGFAGIVQAKEQEFGMLVKEA
jgi:hypothetical protein